MITSKLLNKGINAKKDSDHAKYFQATYTRFRQNGYSKFASYSNSVHMTEGNYSLSLG